MPNLKTLKRRIVSVKNTKKITQAMKLVAASKVRKAQQKVMSSRPYSENLNLIVQKTISTLDSADIIENPLMHIREIKSVGLIVITSDRGLCGSYNTNIIKRAVNRILELKNQNISTKLILIGLKANNFFTRSNTEILESFVNLPAVPTVEEANVISDCAKNAFLNNVIDTVEIIGSNFMSMIKSEIYKKTFLPISFEDSLPESSNTFTLFEPSLKSVLDHVLPLYLSNTLYHALCEASCCELASRMNAMSNATANATDLMDRLTIVYNKGRQAAITQELSEISGGVEALK